MAGASGAGGRDGDQLGGGIDRRGRIVGLGGVNYEIAIHLLGDHRGRCATDCDLGDGQVELRGGIRGPVVHVDPQVGPPGSWPVSTGGEQNRTARLVLQGDLGWRGRRAAAHAGDAHDISLRTAIEEKLLNSVTGLAARGEAAKLRLEGGEAQHLHGLVQRSGYEGVNEGADGGRDASNGVYAAWQLLNINARVADRHRHSVSPW